MLPSVVTYLDTNAISDLFRHGSDWEWGLRRDLRAVWRQRRIQFTTSVWTLEELGGIGEKNWPKYRRVMRYLRDLGTRFLPETSDLLDAEIRRGRALKPKERYIGPTEFFHVMRALGDQRAVVHAYSEARKRLSASLEAHRDRRQEALKGLGRVTPDPRNAANLWGREIESLADDWTRDLIRDAVTKRYGPAAVATYPLDRVPSARSFVAYSMARLRWYLAEQRRIDLGDDVDTHHYAAASYADVFVSGDMNLARIAAFLPKLVVRPISLKDFARSL